MKKTFVFLVLAVTCFFACRKEKNYYTESNFCEVEVGNPGGRSYSTSSISEISYTKKKCGILPLSSNNYWVYQDSIFTNGIFLKVQYDTLRYTSTWKSQNDEFIWWKSSIAIGLPEMLYASDSAIFGLENRVFSPDFKDVKKDFYLFNGESIQFLTSFDDVAAQGQAYKLQNDIKTPLATFKDCIFSEKNARGYRKEQLYFKPGVGVIKYILEKATMGSFVVKPNKVLTLIAFHIE